MRPIVFNGKFYAGGLNGVHRVADRLIRECDALLAAQEPAHRRPARLLLPARRRWTPTLSAITIEEEPGGDSQWWEQAILPRRAAGSVLVNLANLAPIRHAAKVLLIHDAQFLFPDSSYPWRQRIGYRLLVPRMARSSAAVLTVSDYSRQMLDVLGVVPRARTAVLHNGADHILDRPAEAGVLERLGLTRGGYVLLFGSTKAYKNVQVVFSALAGPALGRYRLVVVGPERAAFAGAGASPPADTVFVGTVDDAALRALYEGAHCLAFPSRTEGFGLPPVEAMLCGCPVVASPAGAIPEMCRDAIRYADIDDPDGWRTAILALADEDVRRAKIAAARAVAGRFGWERAGRTLMAAIERVGALADAGARTERRLAGAPAYSPT